MAAKFDDKLKSIEKTINAKIEKIVNTNLYLLEKEIKQEFQGGYLSRIKYALVKKSQLSNVNFLKNLKNEDYKNIERMSGGWFSKKDDALIKGLGALRQSENAEHIANKIKYGEKGASFIKFAKTENAKISNAELMKSQKVDIDRELVNAELKKREEEFYERTAPLAEENDRKVKEWEKRQKLIEKAKIENRKLLSGDGILDGNSNSTKSNNSGDGYSTKLIIASIAKSVKGLVDIAKTGFEKITDYFKASSTAGAYNISKADSLLFENIKNVTGFDLANETIRAFNLFGSPQALKNSGESIGYLAQIDKSLVGDVMSLSRKEINSSEFIKRLVDKYSASSNKNKQSILGLAGFDTVAQYESLMKSFNKNTFKEAQLKFSFSDEYFKGLAIQNVGKEATERQIKLNKELEKRYLEIGQSLGDNVKGIVDSYKNGELSKESAVHLINTAKQDKYGLTKAQWAKIKRDFNEQDYLVGIMRSLVDLPITALGELINNASTSKLTQNSIEKMSKERGLKQINEWEIKVKLNGDTLQIPSSENTLKIGDM